MTFNIPLLEAQQYLHAGAADAGTGDVGGRFYRLAPTGGRQTGEAVRDQLEQVELLQTSPQRGRSGFKKNKKIPCNCPGERSEGWTDVEKAKNPGAPERSAAARLVQSQVGLLPVSPACSTKPRSDNGDTTGGGSGRASSSIFIFVFVFIFIFSSALWAQGIGLIVALCGLVDGFAPQTCRSTDELSYTWITVWKTSNQRHAQRAGEGVRGVGGYRALLSHLGGKHCEHRRKITF